MEDFAEIVEPTRIFIGNGGKATEKLYALEEKRNEAIKACATEWCRLAKIDPNDRQRYWNEAIPQALFDTLESYSPAAAAVAAEAFLKQNGWKIERPS